MTVKVLFFAQARDHAGAAHDSLELGENARVADALTLLRERHPGLAPLWPHLAIALNGELVAGEAAIPAGAELALLPPVSGG